MSLAVHAYLRLHGVKVGRGLRMYSLPFCRRHPQAEIRIGNDVRIANTIRENPAGVSHRTVLVASAPGARLSIGDNVGISGSVLYCAREIVIEDHADLGAGVRIYDTDFHSIRASDRRENGSRATKTGAVHIGEDVWLGANVLVLKGVSIGARSVVGAGAVVTRSIPADTLAAGVPARPIRSLREQYPAC